MTIFCSTSSTKYVAALYMITAVPFKANLTCNPEDRFDHFFFFNLNTSHMAENASFSEENSGIGVKLQA